MVLLTGSKASSKPDYSILRNARRPSGLSPREGVLYSGGVDTDYTGLAFLPLAERLPRPSLPRPARS